MMFLLLYTVAQAKDLVVPPLISRGLESKKVLQITNLISSELDFSGLYDFVNIPPSKPATLTSKCLSSPSCLQAIARENKSEGILAGAVTLQGGNLDFYLVFCEGGIIKNKKAFSIPNTAESLASDLGGHVIEVISGKKVEKQSVEGTSDFIDDDAFEDDDLSMEGIVLEDASIDSFANAERQRAEEEARLRAEEEVQRAQALARQRAEEEARIRAEEEARRRAEEEARRRAEEARIREEQERSRQVTQQYKEDDPLNFDDVLTDDGYSNKTSNSKRKRTEETEEDYLNINLESQKSSQKSSAKEPKVSDFDSFDNMDSSYTKTKKQKPSGSTESKILLTARLGTSKYGAGLEKLVFVTYGGELGFRRSQVALNIGAEGFAAKRLFVIDDVPVEFWNIIIPINFGACYYLSSNSFAPYVGADFLMLPGYLRDEYGNANGIATGARARGGFDVSLSDSMTFNVNTSLGFWSGQGFSLVQQGFSTSSLVPQISMGTSFVF